MPFIGVRISCDILARKVLFALLAWSASALASIASRSASIRAVTSLQENTRPCMACWGHDLSSNILPLLSLTVIACSSSPSMPKNSCNDCGLPEDRNRCSSTALSSPEARISPGISHICEKRWFMPSIRPRPEMARIPSAVDSSVDFSAAETCASLSSALIRLVISLAEISTRHRVSTCAMATVFSTSMIEPSARWNSLSARSST